MDLFLTIKRPFCAQVAKDRNILPFFFNHRKCLFKGGFKFANREAKCSSVLFCFSTDGFTQGRSAFRTATLTGSRAVAKECFHDAVKAVWLISSLPLVYPSRN